MIPEFTKAQLSELTIDRNRPLIICDVDEVVVHFTAAFEDYLNGHGHYLDTSSFALTGNVRHRLTDAPMPQGNLTTLIDDFFVERTAHLEAIDGAIDALTVLSTEADVVMLTNLPHHAREKRIDNLRGHGLTFPCITNAGPKGPAIRHLADGHPRPVVFVDDSPNFIASSWEFAPHVHLVHFLHDERFARHHEPFPYVGLTARSWEEALPHIQALIR